MTALRPIRWARITQAVSLFVIFAATSSMGDRETTMSVLYGGAITAGNLAMMEAITRRLLRKGDVHLRLPLLLLSKTAIVMGLCGAVCLSKIAAPGGFVMGLSTLLAGSLGAAGSLHWADIGSPTLKGLVDGP